MHPGHDAATGLGATSEPRLLTVDEVRKRCRFNSRRPIYGAIERGELRAIRLGRQLRIEPEALEAWKAANVVVPRAPERPSLASHAPPQKGLRRLLHSIPEP